VLRRRLILTGLIFSLPFVVLSSTPPLYAASTATATPSPPSSDTATSGILPELPPLILPPMVDRGVPSNLKPSLENAKSDRPTPYIDRCHTQQNLTASKATCLYGDVTAKPTIVLFGDSHALSWFPAVEAYAKIKKWRFYSLTMSSCWPSDIPAWNSTTHKLMTNCAIWRNNTLNQIVKLHPAYILVSGTRGFATVGPGNVVLTGQARANAWQAGMVRTINRLKLASKHVILLSDTPASIFDPPVCLAAHLKSVLACSTPVDRAVSTAWLAIEKGVADSEKISWIDPTLWVCSTDPCPPIVDNTMIYVDGGHMTATFALSLEKRLASKI
jgi:hypothetical protein